MDTFAVSQDASSASSRKRKADDENSLIVVPSKRARFIETYRRQLFTLPDSIMYYIAKNPSSPEIYAKIVQTCKYFFFKNPVLLISDLFYQDGWKAFENGTPQSIDLDKVSSKVWLSGELLILILNDIQQNLASSLLSKTFKCNVTRLTLWNQHLSYNELMILASKVEHVEFHQVIIKHQDGSILPFEKIFEAFPSAKYVSFACPSTSSAINFNTFAELLKLPQFLILDFCGFKNMPEFFDIEGFYAYMKKNKRTRFELGFSDDVSDAYNSRLEEIVNEIIDAETHDYKPPIIAFRGLAFSKFIKMFRLSFS